MNKRLIFGAPEDNLTNEKEFGGELHANLDNSLNSGLFKGGVTKGFHMSYRSAPDNSS